MASTQAKFAGWSLSFQEETTAASSPASNGIRRGRRGASDSSRLILRRDQDGFEVKSGDTLVIRDGHTDSRVVVLVKDATIGTGSYIELIGLGFLGLDEVEDPPKDTYEQEIFLTSVGIRIEVENIIERATVLNETQFKRTTIDTSNKLNTFLSRRGYDTYFQTYSELFDIKKVKVAMLVDPESEDKRLKDLIVKPPYKSKKDISVPNLGRRKVKKEPTMKAKTSTAKAKPSKPTPTTEKRAAPTKTTAATKRARIGETVVDISDDDSESDSDSDVLIVGTDDKYDYHSSEDEDLATDVSDVDELLFDDDDEFRPHSKTKVLKAKRSGSGKVRKTKAKGSSKESTKRQDKKGPKSIIMGSKKGKNDEAIAENLPCREEQFATLYSAIEAAIEVESGISIYVSGTPGTGKTATIREVIKQLYRRSKADELSEFDYVEINGMKLLTAESAYEALWSKLSKQKVPASSIQGEIESFYQNQKAERPMVILLDELDQLAANAPTVPYNFFNWPTLEGSKVIVVAVANTMDLPERTLTNKTSSRLGLQRVQFPGYTHEQLIEIIHSKFEYLVEDGVELKEDAVQFAARKIASVSGDARRALKICQRAVEIAKKQVDEADHEDDDDNLPIVVHAVHINRAILETSSSPIAQFISDLSFVAKLLLTGILSKKRKSGIAENSLGDIIDEMRQIVSVNVAKDSSQFVVDGKSILDILYKDFIVRPRGFDYVLNELIESGLVLQQNKKSNRNSVVKLNIADEEITSVFKNDKGLKFFVDLTSSN